MSMLIISESEPSISCALGSCADGRFVRSHRAYSRWEYYTWVICAVNWLPEYWEPMPLWFFGERLRQLRHAHNLTQTDLAHRLGLARPGYISNLEAGRKAPSLELVVRIADLFGVTTDDLLRADRLKVVPQAVKLVQQDTISRPPRLFGAKLRHLRLQHDVLQIDLAHELGLARQGYISNLETGRKDPSLELVVRIAERFNTPTDYLLRDSIPVESVRGPRQDSET